MAGLVIGPGLFELAQFIWSAFQPKTIVSGWGVTGVVGVLGATWLALIGWLSIRLHGHSRWIFGIACLTFAVCPVIAMNLEKPGQTEAIPMSPADAQTWENFES